MKKHTLITLVIVISTFFSLTAQEKVTDKFLTKFDLFTDLIQDQPDVLETNWFNRGINIYFMYSFPIKESPVDIQLGTGIGNHNLYHENLLGKDEMGNTHFLPLIDTLSNGGSLDFSKAKVSLTYLDFPIEIHYASKKHFNASIGLKFGLLINSTSKYKGGNYLLDSNEEVKMKIKNLDNLNRLRVGPTIRIGYKWINLYAYYSLTTYFEENKGPEVFPISVGITIGKF